MRITFNGYFLICFLFILIGENKAYALCTTNKFDSILVFNDSIGVSSQSKPTDSVCWMRPDKSRSLFKQSVGKMKNFLSHINEIDTSYIEPQKYNFAFMLQNTNTYEVYRLRGLSEQSITFSPDMTVRVGPYFGWRWMFLGYTLDIKHLDFWHRNNNNTRQEYDLSLYSSIVGLDIYYRRTGNDYKIRRLYLGKDVNTESIRGADFGGLTSIIKGFNFYYIFNNRRFSYPAAFSQSTIQRRSAGSPLLGIGYTQHSLRVNWDELNDLITSRLSNQGITNPVDSTMMFNEVEYTDVSVSGGYAYNWVFAHNWVLACSLSLALAYKRSTGDVTHRRFYLSDFQFNNINFDGIGRFGLVWNNSKWYAGMSTILHTYNYQQKNFSTNNYFGSINIYFGFNFGRRKEK